MDGADTEVPTDASDDQRREIRAWLSTIYQAEHLSLVLGNGLTTGVASLAGANPVPLADPTFTAPHATEVAAKATQESEDMGRGNPNLEDFLRVAITARDGLEAIGSADASEWTTQIDAALIGLLSSVLETENGIAAGAPAALDTLTSFLLAHTSRAPSRDRLHIFTTNYDRLVEHACDRAGVHVLDRFIGALEPSFRSSRLDIDFHYNPPGIRGEPRYLEGVTRLTKLHGSLDWRATGRDLRRVSLPFGGPAPAAAAGDQLIIYPNAAKDIETLAYPYAEMFRDFAAALCRPNSALVTYGYGFGDDHINRTIADMLAIPSTHLVVISYDGADGRIKRFVEKHATARNVTLLIGSNVASLDALVSGFLPAHNADLIVDRVASASSATVGA
jgi:SIR2-like protein